MAQGNLVRMSLARGVGRWRRVEFGSSFALAAVGGLITEDLG